LCVEGPSRDAGIGEFGVANDAGFVYVLMRETELGHGWFQVFRFGRPVSVIFLRNLTPFLRRVVFVGEAAFRAGLALFHVC
jgi:hypothetical protein